MSNNKLIQNLEQIIANLPGLGSRSAKRIVIEMLLNKERLIKNFAQTLLEVYDKIKLCQNCFNLDEQDPCTICEDKLRDVKTLCVVMSISDLRAIEKANFFNGYYYVIVDEQKKSNNIINICEQRLNLLKNKIATLGVEEIILANNSTIEGQTLLFYINDTLEEFINENNLKCKITTLAKGIPLGSDIDYLDEGTLIASFKGRGVL